MTIYPATGDIWEWTGWPCAAIVLFDRFECYDGDGGEYWQVIVLETGKRRSYHVSEDNLCDWKQLA